MPGLVDQKRLRLKQQMEACILAKNIFLAFGDDYREMTEELTELLKTHVLQYEWRKQLEKKLQDLEMTPQFINPMQQDLIKPGSLVLPPRYSLSY